MPLYRYKAVDHAGATQVGDLDASGEAQVIDYLRDRALQPVRVELAAGSSLAASGGALPWKRTGISGDQLLAFTREMATLLKSGLPLDRALAILIELAATPAVALLLQSVRDDVRGGQSFSQALESRGGVFNRFYVNLVRAGEAGGALAPAMARLADYQERAKELRATVVSALVYPTILVLVSLSAVAYLLTNVIPKFAKFFSESGRALPWHTELILNASNWLQSWWWTLPLAMVGVVFWWRAQMANPASKLRWDGRMLRWGRLGDLIVKVEVARMTRTLGALLGNGVNLLTGLGIVRETTGNLALAAALEDVVRKLREGKGLGKPLAETGLFPKLAVNMVLVGEESGQLEEMLLRVADIYDKEVKTAVQRLLSLLEPAMILLLAVVIGGIVMSVLTTMMSAYGVVGGGG